MSLLKKLVRENRDLKEALQRLSELLEGQRALIQLGAHELEMCGKHEASPLNLLRGAMTIEVLKESPFYRRMIEKLENECRNKDHEIAVLKADNTKMRDQLDTLKQARERLLTKMKEREAARSGGPTS